MKTTIIALLGFLLASISYSQTEAFRLGFAGTYPDGDLYNTTKNTNWSWYPELSLNMWQGFYISDKQPEILDSCSRYNLWAFFNPDTIIWAAFGKMAVHQAEETSDRFSYDNHWCGSNYTDNTQWGSGQLVRKFDINDPQCGNGPSGTVLWNVHEKGFQSYANNDPLHEYFFKDENGNFVIGKWYIMPRMRINVTDTGGTETPVVKIIVKAFNGDTVLQQIITNKNFRFPNGTYDGSYLEEYRNLELWVWADSLNRGRPEPYGNWSVLWTGWDTCHVDYQVYWYGTVNVWIDYVKVMNNQAYQFLRKDDDRYREIIKRKAQTLVDHDTGNVMKGFYTEEIDYSDLMCMKAVNDSLAAWFDNSDKVKIYGLINYQTYSFCLRTHNGQEIQDYITAIHPPYHMAIFYPFDGYCPNCNPQPGFLPQNVSFFNNGRYTQDIINYETSGINAMHRAYGDYNTLLQNKLQLTADTIFYQYNLARQSGIRFIAEPQVCNWKTDTLNEFQREPMNSEFGAMCGIAICRGAQGIMPFEYQTGFAPANNSISIPRVGYSLPDNAAHGYPVFFYGMTDADPNNWWGKWKRDTNFYGEPKWNYVRDLYAKIKNYWGPIAANSVNTLGYSVYRDEADHEYITDIQSIVPGMSGQNPCINGLPYGPYLDCPYERYWEMGFFNMASESYDRYFMLTNRRCIPDGGGYTYDNRVVKIQFNSANLPGSFDNWKLTGLGEESAPVYFHRNYEDFVDLGTTQGTLGWFKPGESKLFKIEPVIKGGGTLVADENIENQNFTCVDTVWNDGYNITITGSSDVSFSDSATIIMNSGTFTSGDASGGAISNKITYTSAVSGHKWGGLRFSDANVKIYNSEFLNISSNSSNYAITSIDCPLNDIRYNIFTSSTDTAGGVNIAYVNYSIFGSPPNSYLMYNTFTMNNSHSRAMQVQGFAGLTEGVYVKGNTMSSNGYATGIFLSTITGGVIKQNSLSGFETAINTVSSTCDLYGNSISNSIIESKGVYGVESSVLNLAPSGSQWTGGMNSFSNTKDNSLNIDIDASNFILTSGANAFDLLSTAEEPYHLYGSFVSESYNSNATGNCFKLSGTEINDPELPNNYLTDGYEQVTLDFIAYNCSQSIPECSDIVDIGNGLYDTIPRTCGGGGGEMGASTRLMHSKNFILTPKQLQDSIKIQMRHRNYSRVKTLCNELIGNYPESIESISSLQTLYMASVLSDTTTSSRSALKAYYEGLILNHGNNQALVEISNYLVQKCKVLLRQYTSALAGFQAIINNNQYNYRGLLARWDYMATSLLVQGQGGGDFGSEATVSLHSIDIVDAVQNESEEFDEYDKLGDDKNPYSKEERAAIQKNVRTVYEKTKNYGEKRIEILEREARQNNQRAKNELQRINTMKQVIKVEKPKNVIEHIKIVNNDIQSIFGSTLSNKSTSINNIPSVFRLAQNYPNPFNPVTTIKYELPKDSKVKLVVYDLLGREVKTLVNEVKTAGYYQLEFNMQNYASGVYFYRIEADDLSGKKFVDAKKMVLVK